MKKIILLALTALMMVGCYDRQSKVVDGVDVVAIDSCEYIMVMFIITKAIAVSAKNVILLNGKNVKRNWKS